MKNRYFSGSIFSHLFVLLAVLLAVLSTTACTFDYGTGDGSEESRPDIVMANIEYVRIRGGDMLARFQAEYAERWERTQTMNLREFSFEQMEDRGETVNVEGSAAEARVFLDSGDMLLSGGVIVSIESEDITINTRQLEWRDEEKHLIGASGEEVDITRADGTNFTGIGLSASIRSRSWGFSGEVFGTYVEEDDEDEDDSDSASHEVEDDE